MYVPKGLENPASLLDPARGRCQFLRDTVLPTKINLVVMARVLDCEADACVSRKRESCLHVRGALYINLRPTSVPWHGGKEP